MKKLQLKKRSKREPEAPARITNETVAEHREKILAGGRKFKYPVQYAKHKLVANAIIVALVALVALVVLTGVQLYVAQSSGTFFYRLSRIVPVPVASVDGELVRFSDYLRGYRGSEHYLVTVENIRPTSEGGKQQLDYIKRTVLTSAEMEAYAAKLARKHNVSVSNKDVEAAYAAMKEIPSGSVSDDVLSFSALSMYDWSATEAKEALRSQLRLHKVKYAVDSEAKTKAEKAAQLLKAEGATVKAIAEQLSDDTYKVDSGASGATPIANAAGILTEAAKLGKGQRSGVIESPDGDGYYVLHIVEKTDTVVNYEFVHIPLAAFVKQFEQIRREGKIREFISVPDITSPEGQQSDSKQ